MTGIFTESVSILHVQKRVQGQHPIAQRPPTTYINVLKNEANEESCCDNSMSNSGNRDRYLNADDSPTEYLLSNENAHKLRRSKRVRESQKRRVIQYLIKNRA